MPNPIVGNLPSKGAITQGEIIGSLDFTATSAGVSIWTFAVILQGGINYLFAKHSSQSGFAVFSDDSLIGIGGKAGAGSLGDILDLASQPAAAYITANVSYAPNTAQTIMYTNGTGGFKSTPYEDTTVDKAVQDALDKNKKTAAGDTPDAVVKKWYEKPITWIVAGVAVIGSAVAYMVWGKK